MSHYLLSVHGGHEPPSAPAPADMEDFMARLVALESEMDEAGAFVFSGRLHGPEAAVVVRWDGDELITEDGPRAEADRHMAGFYIIEAADLGAALGWAAKVAEAVGVPIEVRPFFATGRVADQMGSTSQA